MKINDKINIWRKYEIKNENYNIWNYWNNVKNIIFEIIKIKNEESELIY